MATYKNITKTGVTFLVPNLSRSTGSQRGGEIDSIYVSNNSVNAATISVYLEDNVSNSNFYFIKNIVIPSKVAFILDKSLSFTISRHSLRLSTSDVSPDLTIIIK